VGNAYLLCRIADTIEDDPELSAADKRRFSDHFVRVLEGGMAPIRFSSELYPRLSPRLPASERELVLNTPRVVQVTRSFEETSRAPMRRCVRIMSRGMARFQEGASRDGLPDMAALDSYCYHVAGVVGEMLTELFCLHEPAMARERTRLLSLAVSFGQGLQMTNILKDVWEDFARGACWLPRDVFQSAGFDLSRLTPGCQDARFREGYTALLAVARGHLSNALEYTLAIPASQGGMRRFCLWALGMAVLTLRRIHDNPGFRSGAQVKISRRAVRGTMSVTRVCVGHDWLLRLLFETSTRRLPAAPTQQHALSM
jgi:farnesyl-diphosphate farnesyltransferase